MSPRTGHKSRHRATAAHAAIYRRTSGKVFGSIGGQPVMLLTTTGRRSGEPRTTPVQYVPYDGGLLVVAAAGGAPKPPAWALNLLAEPIVHAQVGDETRAFVGRRLTGSERSTAWAALLSANRRLASVQSHAGRELDVFALRPVDDRACDDAGSESRIVAGVRS